jgi:hypothetical protein
MALWACVYTRARKVEIHLVWNLFNRICSVRSRRFLILVLVQKLNNFNIRVNTMSAIDRAFQLPWPGSMANGSSWSLVKFLRLCIPGLKYGVWIGCWMTRPAVKTDFAVNILYRHPATSLTKFIIYKIYQDPFMLKEAIERIPETGRHSPSLHNLFSSRLLGCLGHFAKYTAV